MTRSSSSARRNRMCRGCVLRSLAGVAWPMWGARGWPQVARCQACARRTWIS